MKTFTKTLFTVCAVISLSANAQRNGGSNPRQGNQNQNNNSNTTTWSSNTTTNTIDSRRGGGYVNIHVGGGGGYSNNYYGNGGGYTYSYNNYNNGYNCGGYNNYGGYNIKAAARNSIHQSAGFIGQALQFSEWNDIYSPWLAKAIRHQQYARQLYFWGDFAGALNHAERAGYLAWNTLSYFNNGYGYNNGGYGGNVYPDPYSDPNNPYYRQNNSSSQPANDMSSGDDYGYSDYNKRSAAPTTTGIGAPAKTSTSVASQGAVQKMELSKIDETLPVDAKLSDRELLKTSAKDLDIE
jgi:hypothetical protein